MNPTAPPDAHSGPVHAQPEAGTIQVLDPPIAATHGATPVAGPTTVEPHETSDASHRGHPTPAAALPAAGAAPTPVPPEPTVTELLQGIHDAEGYTGAEMASLLRMAERTVQRDRAELRSRDALNPDRKLGDELLGELQRLTLASVQRLTRLARDQDPRTPPYARLWAEDAISKVYTRFLDATRRLSYLEDGHSRLTHQRNTSPQTDEERFQAKLARMGRF